ncbi:hypothetical protein DENSPDRAFT_395311 [Dentipellis sp. KUC8613]|nr:hypothetical protein DENSPDRAFT_395311 [Dentipellis sp. KUC8613]
MRSSGLLLYYRFFLFGLLVVCNAIICSAGVWNLSLAQSAGSSPPVDAFMIFLGAFSLVLVLPITFFDVFVKHAWTGWVGTECVWVTLLWIFHLAGAAAVTALLPTLMCNVQMERTTSDSCTSTRLLQVPAWICALALTIYVVLFTAAVAIHRRRNPTLWYASVRTYPWFDHLRSQSQEIKSAPASPIAVLAPRPTRPVDLPSPSVLGAGLQYEHLTDFNTAERPMPPTPAAPAPTHVLQETRQVSSGVTMPSLYPLHMQPFLESGIAPAPAVLEPSLSPAFMYANPGYARADPPPLGDWPRADIIQQPTKPRPARRKAPPATEPAPPPVEPDADARPSDETETHQRQTSASLPSSDAANRPRPGGPRHRSGSSVSARPPPLDLSRISNIER